MRHETEENDNIRNYYQGVMNYIDGLRYRLSGDDVIEQVVDTLRGGVKTIKGNVKEYHEENRLLNEIGVARAKMLLQGGVNKINHLTKYANENRILQQMKAIMHAWIFELVLNMKRWAPEAEIDERGVLISKENYKVRNPRLVIQVIENAIYQSMLRGTEGFEAELLSKSMFVQETVNRDDGRQRGGGGPFSRLFGGRRQQQQVGEYYG